MLGSNNYTKIQVVTKTIGITKQHRMEIEKEIQQNKPFRSPHHKAGVNILFTNNWLCTQIKAMLKPFDITLQQYNMLRILRGAGKPMSTSCIRERMIDRMSDTSRLVDRLCQKGWVNRDACCFDKRRVDVTVSQKGLDLILEIEGADTSLEKLLTNLTDEEALLLSSLLDKVRQE